MDDAKLALEWRAIHCNQLTRSGHCAVAPTTQDIIALIERVRKDERAKLFPEILAASGGYKASSRADGTILVEPEWPQFPKWDEDEGGGPGVMSRLSVAECIEKLLNEAIRARHVD